MITRTHVLEDACFSYHVASAKARDLLREHSMRSWNRAVSQVTMYDLDQEIPKVAFGQITRRLERLGIAWDPREGTLSVAVEADEDDATGLTHNEGTHTYQATTTKPVTTVGQLDEYLVTTFKTILDHVTFYMAGSLAAAASRIQ